MTTSGTVATDNEVTSADILSSQVPQESSVTSPESTSFPEVITAIESVTGSTFVTTSRTVETDNGVTFADILSTQVPQESSVASPKSTSVPECDKCN